jgi:TrmH family RNA methyltransferase
MPKDDSITSRSNPIIKSARSLRERKERNKSGKFIVEGILPVGEAAAAGWAIEYVLFAPDLVQSDFARELISQESEKGVRCISVTRDVLESIAEKENPQGIIAVVNQKITSLSGLIPEKFHRVLALVSPQDPGNVGTILRTLDAVNADGLILLDGGVDPFHPSAVRASMGTLFWKPVIQSTYDEFHAWCVNQGYRLIGTSAHGELDYREVILDPMPFVLVLGNEQKGLSQTQLMACDVSIKIPMMGRASSLNLAVAAGVLLYKLFEDQ